MSFSNVASKIDSYREGPGQFAFVHQNMSAEDVKERTDIISGPYGMPFMTLIDAPRRTQTMRILEFITDLPKTYRNMIKDTVELKISDEDKEVLGELDKIHAILSKKDWILAEYSKKMDEHPIFMDWFKEMFPEMFTDLQTWINFALDVHNRYLKLKLMRNRDHKPDDVMFLFLVKHYGLYNHIINCTTEEGSDDIHRNLIKSFPVWNPKGEGITGALLRNSYFNLDKELMREYLGFKKSEEYSDKIEQPKFPYNTNYQVETLNRDNIITNEQKTITNYGNKMYAGLPTNKPDNKMHETTDKINLGTSRFGQAAEKKE